MRIWKQSTLFGIVAILVLAFVLVACGDGNGNGENNSDEYYIKYEVNSSTIYSGVKLDVTIKNEHNNNTNFTINARTQWETVIGPVKKGYTATLKVSSDSTVYNTLALYAQISASKNNGPFALKKVDGSETARSSVQINYTIDF